MIDINMINIIREKYQNINKVLDERSRRIWAATEAKVLGYGGQSVVSKATGISRTTINVGLKELIKEIKATDAARRIRSPGGGRKKLIEKDTLLLEDLESLVEPTTRGDPESPLRWTCKSTRQIALILKQQGHKIGRQKVADLLSYLGYSLQGNRKTIEGSSHPDRNGQFNYINSKVKEYQRNKQPVISVDTKKKELIGKYKNGGKEWQPKGKPEEVDIYDFINKDVGKVSPYGVYDQTANVGWVSVGIDHDTAEFAVESIRRWWYKMGLSYYPNATELLITADGGGSNGYRIRLWKVALQELANELKMNISVCHFPPGTSKWNKIEHRMFSFISMNWRGRPLISYEVIVNLIANTTNSKGLKINAQLDTNSYQTGIKITDKELKKINVKKDEFHGEWNYTIMPNYI